MTADIWIKIICALAVSSFFNTANAGTFEDNGRHLDQVIDDILQRLDALEAGSPTPPGPDPDPEPDPPTPPPTPEPVVSVEPGQDPAVQSRIPGRIQAEDFDHGGEGIAYHDSTPENLGGDIYRADQGVDVKATRDENGLFQVGWTYAGANSEPEWIEFTVGATAGVYDVHFRVSCNVPNPPCGKIRMIVDGIDKGTIQVPHTGDWDRGFETVVLPGIEVTAGNQIIRLEFIDNYLDLNWFQFTPQDTAKNDPPFDIVFECLQVHSESGNCSVDENDPGATVGTMKVVP